MLWEGVGRIQTIQMLPFKQHKMLGISKTSLTLNKVLWRCLGQIPQRLDWNLFERLAVPLTSMSLWQDTATADKMSCWSIQ